MQATPLIHRGPVTYMTCRSSNNKHAVEDFLYCWEEVLQRVHQYLVYWKSFHNYALTTLHTIYHITNDKQRIWTPRHHSEWQERVFAMERKYSSTVCKLTILKRCAGKLIGSKEL